MRKCSIMTRRATRSRLVCRREESKKPTCHVEPPLDDSANPMSEIMDGDTPEEGVRELVGPCACNRSRDKSTLTSSSPTQGPKAVTSSRRVVYHTAAAAVSCA